MVKILDLLFHKIYTAYAKKEKNVFVSIFATIVFFSVTMSSFLLFIGVSVDLLLENVTTNYLESMSIPSRIKKYIFIIIELPIIVYLFYRYTRKGKIQALKEMFSDKKYARLKSWHVFMIPILFVIVTAIMIFLFAENLRFPAFEN